MWSSSTPRFHAGAWLFWLASAMVAALVTRNPYYLSLVIIAAIVVYNSLERESGGAKSTSSRRLLLGTVVGLTVTVALFKGLSLHAGTTVLFVLPEAWPVIGGPITLEAIVWALLDALSLLAVLAVFTAFSAGADYYAILRGMPAFLHQVGLVASIAITFVPATVERFAEIREAQALRGHKIRRVGDLLPLIMPLLAGGMERSMDLAEAMEARGFSRNPAGSRRVRPLVTQTCIAISMGLVLIGSALPAFAPTLSWAGWACIAVGVGLFACTLWAMSRGVKRSRYRRAVWRERDTLLAAASIGVLVFLVTLRVLEPSVFVYYPFPTIHLPTFDLLVAGLLLMLTAPVLILKLTTARENAQSNVPIQTCADPTEPSEKEWKRAGEQRAQP